MVWRFQYDHKVLVGKVDIGFIFAIGQQICHLCKVDVDLMQVSSVGELEERRWGRVHSAPGYTTALRNGCCCLVALYEGDMQLRHHAKVVLDTKCASVIVPGQPVIDHGVLVANRIQIAGITHGLIERPLITPRFTQEQEGMLAHRRPLERPTRPGLGVAMVWHADMHLGFWHQHLVQPVEELDALATR